MFNDIAYIRLCKYVLDTHYTNTNALNIVCSIYYGLIELMGDTNETIHDAMMRTLTYLCRKGIGKFAFTFHRQFWNAIDTEDYATLIHILVDPKFVEIEDNPYLLAEDQEYLILMLNREIQTFHTVYERMSTEKVLSIAQIQAQCYNTVCDNDVCVQEKDTILQIFSKYSRPCATCIYTADHNVAYCFDLLELVAIMSEPEPINPYTGNVFSEYTITTVGDRLRKEIAMYRRYLDEV